MYRRTPGSAPLWMLKHIFGFSLVPRGSTRRAAGRQAQLGVELLVTDRPDCAVAWLSPPELTAPPDPNGACTLRRKKQIEDRSTSA